MISKPAKVLIEEFDLKPHPFDGWYSEIKTAALAPPRYHYLMQLGEYTDWHRTSGQLIMTHIDGAPIEIMTSLDGHHSKKVTLGTDDNPTRIIKPNSWRSWECQGYWSLMLITAETSEDFLQWRLAPDKWTPHWP